MKRSKSGVARIKSAKSLVNPNAIIQIQFSAKIVRQDVPHINKLKLLKKVVHIKLEF